MAGFLGAVTEQMRECADLMEQRARALHELAGRCSHQVQAAEWTGPDAETFREQARQQFGEELPTVARLISSRARSLERHADEQDRASDVDGAAEAAGLPGRDGMPGADPLRPGLPRTGGEDAAEDDRGPMGTPSKPYTHGHEGQRVDPLQASAAGRDERDLLQEYLPAGMHPSSSTQWSNSDSHFISVQERLAGYDAGEGFKNEKVGVSGTTTYTTKFSEKGILMPDGSVVFASTSTVSVAESRGVSVGVGQGGGSGSTGATATVTTSQEITVPPGVELPPDFNPHDASTYPEGVRVRFDDAAGLAGNWSGGVSAEHRGVKGGFDVFGGSGRSTGASMIVENLGDGRVGVTQGPTAAFDETRGFSLSLTGLDALKVSASFSSGDHSSGWEYQSAAFDQGTGDPAMREFMSTGEIAADATGVHDRMDVQVMNQWHSASAEVKGSVGGPTVGENGESTGRVDAGESWNLWGSTSQMRSAITVNYHEDGSTRSMIMYADDPSTGMYAVEDGIILDGTSTRENYLHVPVTGDAVEGRVKDLYEVTLDGDEAIQIHYTPEQMQDLAAMQRGSVTHSGMMEGFGDSPLPEVLADQAVADPTSLLDHLLLLEARSQEASRVEDVGLLPGVVVRDPDAIAEAAANR